MYQIGKEMFGASELHQYLSGLLPLYLEFAPACRYAGSATLSSETQSLRRVVNEDAMRNMLISEKRTESGEISPPKLSSCQTHSVNKRYGQHLLSFDIHKVNEPLKLFLENILTFSAASITKLTKNCIQT